MVAESVWEAVADAGYSMADLAGSSTGVYVGGCFSDLHKALLRDLRLVSGYENTGCSHAMFANRVSFYFDLKGPSMTIDTACSSSLVALHQALQDLSSGVITRAIVGGVSVVTDPALSKSFHMYNMLSPTGRCHSFDDLADGYVRADCIGALLLESASLASSGYLRVLGSGVNSDGWKQEGVTFPSAAMQAQLCRSVLERTGIDSAAVRYVEAHGTGTVVGDRQELAAIDAVFGGTGVLVGSVKSNMGHSEGASGVAAVIKVALLLSEGVIPANLHFNSTSHEPLLAGRLAVVDSTRAFQGGLVAVNNFGFGGTNALLVCESGVGASDASEATTRMVFGRSRAALEAYVSSNQLSQAYWSKLLRSSGSVGKFPWRGLVTPGPEGAPVLEVSEVGAARPLAFSYTGQGSQWLGMGADLWRDCPTFRATVEDACAELPVDAGALFTAGDRWLDKAWSGLGITLVQLGLTALLREAGLRPDFIFGHSVGEVACGYADGCTSAREAASIAFVRCRLSDQVTANGLMVAAGLSIEEAHAIIEPFADTVVACHNSPDGVTLSGRADEITLIRERLESEGRFVRLVPTDGVAYHSTFFKRNKDRIKAVIEEAMPPQGARQQRSSRWLSTSGQDAHRLADAEYHASNVVGMVSFCPVVAALPAHTVVVEVGPRSLLKSVIQRCNGGLTVLGAMAVGEDGTRTVRRLLDDLWLAGVAFDFPRHTSHVPLRQRVAMHWDHAADWRVAKYKDLEGGRSTVVTYDLLGKDAYLLDHVIDGRAIFPAAGYVYTAWQVIGGDSLHLSEVRILKAVLLSEDKVSFIVCVEEEGWRIFHGAALVCKGRVAQHAPVMPDFPLGDMQPAAPIISGADLYRTFARRGYEYGPAFRLIGRKSADQQQVELSETEHWIALIDNVLQASIIDPTGIKLPTEMASVVIMCKSVRDAGLRLGHLAHLDATGNGAVMVQGLKTSLSRKSHRKPVVRGVDFVYYGEHRYAHEEAYKRRLLRQLVLLFWRVHGSCSSSKYPFLDKVASLCPAKDDVKEAARGEGCDAEGSLEQVVRCVADMDCEQALDNVYFAISTSPGHDEVYFSDPSASVVGALDGLEVMAQIVRDNLGRAYSLLEVGAGSGGLTRNLFPLVSADVSAYTASDVSVVKQYFPSVSCVKYDVNLAWTEASVDVVAASNSLHTCANISVGLRNIHSALTEDGFLILHEYISVVPALLWGLSDFAFSSEDERDWALWISKDRWMLLLRANGFEPVTWYVDAGETQMLMLARKVPDTLTPSSAVEMRDRIVARDRHQLVAGENVLLKTDDFGYLGMVRSLRKEPGFQRVRLSLSISEHNGSAGYRTSLSVSGRKEGRLGCMHQVALRTSSASARGYRAVIKTPGDLSSLRWTENPADTNCVARFCGVNFKDVMLAYGKLTSEGEVLLGLEFSGTRAAEEVMGISVGCMATRVFCPEHLLWPVPARLSLEQAASVPVVYATAYYALVVKANVRRGQTVLIHSIAGGVGQAAFHLCRHRGVHVIATCSREKRAWVREHMGLADHLILDSHSLSFRNGVMGLTKGQGVDVVLNSLASTMLLYSLDCVASYGHFCEIGKFDMQENSRIGLRALERNVSFHGIDLSDMFDKPRVWQPVRELVAEGLRSGEVVPIECCVLDDVEEALRTISAGKHIGKIVVRIPPASVVASQGRRCFRTSGTHLVVGGTGGFGLELVAYLFSRGAQEVVVVCRSAPDAFQLRGLGSATVVHADLASEAACDALVQGLGARLVGVWHLAMVLNDRLYANMTDEAWDQTVAPKAAVARNLDRSTRAHSSALEHFVCWSSVTALFGNAGQTNYAYANSAMEGVCFRRKEDGLCGLAIQWGLIGAVGVMVNKGTNDAFKFAPQHIDSCLEVLDDILHCDHAIVTSYVSAEAKLDTAATVTLSDKISRVLGVSTSKVNAADSLASLGMDSLQSVEVANLLKVAGHGDAFADLKTTLWASIKALD